MKKSNERIAIQVARNSILINIALAAFKLFAGIFAHSAAMVSDAIHSISDLIGTVIAVIGIKLANKKPDKEHPYGHERFESVATLALGGLILIVGLGIGWSGLQLILSGNFEEIPVPGVLALIAAALSIGVKESLFWYVRSKAKKIDSSVLMADAWHSRSDGIASIGSLIGIFGARLGFLILDSVVSLLISLLIVKTAISILLDAIGKMTDRACDDAFVTAIHDVILQQEGVLGIDLLKTRIFGNRIFVDAEITLDSSLSFIEAHQIVHQVHDAIEGQFPKIKHCEIHANPSQPMDFNYGNESPVI